MGTNLNHFLSSSLLVCLGKQCNTAQIRVPFTYMGDSEVAPGPTLLTLVWSSPCRCSHLGSEWEMEDLCLSSSLFLSITLPFNSFYFFVRQSDRDGAMNRWVEEERENGSLSNDHSLGLARLRPVPRTLSWFPTWMAWSPGSAWAIICCPLRYTSAAQQLGLELALSLDNQLQ